MESENHSVSWKAIFEFIRGQPSARIFGIADLRHPTSPVRLLVTQRNEVADEFLPRLLVEIGSFPLQGFNTHSAIKPRKPAARNPHVSCFRGYFSEHHGSSAE